VKQALLAAISGATRRHAVLLPSEARHEDGMAAVSAPYRVDGETLALDISEPGPALLDIAFIQKGVEVWQAGGIEYSGPGVLSQAMATGEVSWGGRSLGSVSGGQPMAARRFEWRLRLTARCEVRSRRTGHYVARSGAGGDASYYQGEDYVDYELESQAVHDSIVALAREQGASGPVLEIGCATGGTLAALEAAGMRGFGVDLSAWAVDQAAARLGPGRAFVCNVERDPLPEQIAAAAPFGLLVLASVFEHFARPFDVAAALAPLVRPGGLVLIITSNADSLSHRVFGRDWEGYFDWTHLGVDQVTPAALRAKLPEAGWQVRSLRTWHVWDGSSDPTHATLREWFAADARFRRLLEERELGDFITCVAVRE
jgi:SAM-dependent methyltransferase